MGDVTGLVKGSLNYYKSLLSRQKHVLSQWQTLTLWPQFKHLVQTFTHTHRNTSNGQTNTEKHPKAPNKTLRFYLFPSTHLLQIAQPFFYMGCNFYADHSHEFYVSPCASLIKYICESQQFDNSTGGFFWPVANH